MSAEHGSGREYLARVTRDYLNLQRVLPTLSEAEFEAEKYTANRQELGVGSFLADFAIAADQRRRNLERWAEGRSITPATAEHAAKVISTLPSFTIANPEAVGAMRVSKERKYRIDVVVEDIISEIAQRLPRKVDAYRYRQDDAHETLQVPGLGEVKVTMHKTGNGVFSTIGTVEGENFRIWNCRQSGVTYMDRYNDISRPSEVTIKRKKKKGLLKKAEIDTTKIELYSDTSGINVELNGKRFTNARWRTAIGSGYDSDMYRDDLHRTYSGGNDMNPRYREINRGWRTDKTVLSWEEVEGDTIVWLAENVLEPLKKVKKPKEQATTVPEEDPFPEGKVGPLYAFVDEETLQKIAFIKHNPGKAYPDERKAARPGKRLLSLGMPRKDAPEIAYDGFVWCGVGEINDDTDLHTVKDIGLDYRWDDPPFHSQGIAVLKPKTATDVYVVDWQEWDNFRERTFTPTHDRLTDVEYADLHVAVARTLKPITEYDGSYKKPLVLIGRDIELDEVEAVYLPPQDRRR